VPATVGTGDLPDYAALPAVLLDRVTIAYLCSPANPQGAVATEAYWRDLIALAEKHDFRIFADECYSEIYRNTPPVGALQVAHDMGADPDRVVVFHSLSKRSNLPGLRSGFAASGSGNIAAMKQLKNYTGAPLPLPLQAAAALAWRDEAHVEENRAIYRRKYQMADEIFGNVAGYQPLEAGFFLWLPVENDEAAALKLWREAGVRCLPGSYLSRAVAGQAIGQDRLRVALVAEEQELQRGLLRLHGCLYQ
jgi:aspartate/methionine/tyrosine aminotransferase